MKSWASVPGKVNNMSNTKENGGAAFPQINHWDNDRMRMGDSGMSLRDYFAAHALSGVVVRRWEDDNGKMPSNVIELWAAAAYGVADAMLEARETERPNASFSGAGTASAASDS